MNVDTSSYFHEHAENGRWISFPDERLKPQTKLTPTQVKQVKYLMSMEASEALHNFYLTCHTCKLIVGPLHCPDTFEQDIQYKHAGHNTWVETQGKYWNPLTKEYS